MESKLCVISNTKKVLINFTTNIEIVNSVTLKEVQNVILKTKIKYQINKKLYMKKREKDN